MSLTSSSTSSTSSSSSSMDTSSKGSHGGIWIEKYRPSSLTDVIAHEHIVSTIQKLIDAGRLPHLLFYGPPGTGKTSTILAVARKMFGPNFRSMLLELNASDDRGIGVVREQIKTFASTRKIFSSGMKLIVLDEADSMTKDAQAALRRVMEKYTKNTRFCLICNYVNKIIPALQSRCTQFRFSPLSLAQIQPRLEQIILAEGVPCDEPGKKAVIRLAGGDMRRCLNVLQSTFMAHGEVTESNVYNCTGNPKPAEMITTTNNLLNESFADSLEHLSNLVKVNGYAVDDILTELSVIGRKINFPDEVRMQLYATLADIEYRLSKGSNPHIQLAAIVAAFQLAKEQTVPNSSAESQSQSQQSQ